MDALLDWARSAGAVLAQPFDGASADVAPLSGLDELVDGADLTFLGELDHFVHEKSDFRLLLCRYLLSRGWRSFAEELSWSDGVRVQRFLCGEDGLERLSLFGYRGDLRADRPDRRLSRFLRPISDSADGGRARPLLSRTAGGCRRSCAALARARHRRASRRRLCRHRGDARAVHRRAAGSGVPRGVGPRARRKRGR